MVTAPVLALEDTRPAWIKDQTRRELHEGVDLWLDTLEEAVQEEPPSLDTLARAVLARRQELTALITGVSSGGHPGDGSALPPASEDPVVYGGNQGQKAGGAGRQQESHCDSGEKSEGR